MARFNKRGAAGDFGGGSIEPNIERHKSCNDKEKALRRSRRRAYSQTKSGRLSEL